jgi:hypothetical protein
MIRWRVRVWKEAEPELEQIRRRETREADTWKAIQALDGAFKQALRTMAPRQTSGLVEMQRRLKKLAR